MEFIDNLAARLAQERAATAAALETARQTLEASRQTIRQELQDKGIPTREDVNITEAAAVLASVKAGERISGQSSGFIGGVRKTVGGAVSGLGTTLFAGEQIARHPVDTARTIASPEGRENIAAETKTQLAEQVKSFREAPLSEKAGIAVGFGLIAKGPRIVKGAGGVAKEGATLTRGAKVSREGIVSRGEKVTPSQVAARIKGIFKTSAPETRATPAQAPKTITEAITFSEKARATGGDIKKVETLEVGAITDTAKGRQAPLEQAGKTTYENPFERGRAPTKIEATQRIYEREAQRLTERSQPIDLLAKGKKGEVDFLGRERTLEPAKERTGSILEPSGVMEFTGYKEATRTFPRDLPGERTTRLYGKTTRPKGRAMDLILGERGAIPRSQELIHRPESELWRTREPGALDLTYITDKPREPTLLERYQREAETRRSPGIDIIEPTRLRPVTSKFTFMESTRSYRGLLDISRPSLRMAGLSTFGLLDLQERTKQKQESILETSQRQEQRQEQEQIQLPILETSQRQEQRQEQKQETILETTQKQDLIKITPLLGLGFKSRRTPPPEAPTPTPIIPEPRKGRLLGLIPGGGGVGKGISFGGSARGKRVKDIVTLDISLDLGGSKGFDFGTGKKGGKKGRGFF